jgi:hypothetical protein
MLLTIGSSVKDDKNKEYDLDEIIEQGCSAMVYNTYER